MTEQRKQQKLEIRKKGEKLLAARQARTTENRRSRGASELLANPRYETSSLS